MAVTTVRGPQVRDGSIQRVDVDVATVGQALIRKVLEGTLMNFASTGADAGTGDVTINFDTAGGDARYQLSDADLTAIAALAGTSGILKKTGAGVWVLDLGGTIPTGGVAGQILVKNSSTDFDASFVTDILNNASIAQQTFAAVDRYVTGSDITVPAGSWTAGSKYHCVFDLTKTAAGVVAPALTLRIGTLGSISDAARATLNFNAQTAAADVGIVDAWATFRAVGASGVVQLMGRIMHFNASTGLCSANTSVTYGTSAAFSTTTLTKIGISFNGGTSFSATCEVAQADYVQK